MSASAESLSMSRSRRKQRIRPLDQDAERAIVTANLRQYRQTQEMCQYIKSKRARDYDESIAQTRDEHRAALAVYEQTVKTFRRIPKEERLDLPPFQ